MYIYVNGKMVKKEEAVISPFDHGFLYGLGVFETFRVYNGHLFLFDDHYVRLLDALQQMNINWKVTKEEAMQIVRELLEVNDLQDAYVRFNVSAGIGDIGLQVDAYEEPSIIVFLKPLPKATEEVQEKEVVILQTKRNTPEGAYRLKSHHYLNCVLGKREVGKDMSKEGVFLTENGFVAEGVVSNIFFVKEGAVYTPSIETGILNGITRQFVMMLCECNGIPIQSGLFTVEELRQADEVFATNSIQEIVPIVGIDNARFIGKDGEITKRLIQYYQAYRTSLISRYDVKEGK
jgi:4-amino-4-deoxychorismate lyase